MAGDEDPITLTQIKTRVDRLALAVERLNQGRVRDRVDGRQRRDPTLQDKSYSDDRRGYRRKENYDAGGLKIPSFNGKLHDDDFLDWIDEVDRYFEEFFKSTADPHAANKIHMMWERFIYVFDSEEVLAEEVKEQIEKINAKYKADADRCRRRKIFIDEATIQVNISSGSSFFQQGETDVGRLTNNLKEERDNHELNADLYILLASTKKRSYLLIRKADSDILYMKIAYLDETKPTRLSDFQNLISITSC